MRDLCFQTHPIGDLPVIECKYEGWIGQQPWVLVFSVTGCGIDIIRSLNIQQECIHSLMVVENLFSNGIQEKNICFNSTNESVLRCISRNCCQVA
jgi:hypothetical protein